jgi:hypothetical protein
MLTARKAYLIMIYILQNKDEFEGKSDAEIWDIAFNYVSNYLSRGSKEIKQEFNQTLKERDSDNMSFYGR